MTRLQLKCWLQITGTAQEVFEWGGGGGGRGGRIVDFYSISLKRRRMLL